MIKLYHHQDREYRHEVTNRTDINDNSFIHAKLQVHVNFIIWFWITVDETVFKTVPDNLEERLIDHLFSYKKKQKEQSEQERKVKNAIRKL